MNRKALIIKCAKVITKFTELSYWLVSAVMAAGAAISIGNPAFITNFWAKHADAAGMVGMSSCGFELVVGVENSARASVLFFIAAVVLPALMALIFHKLYLIIKNSENSTPFQEDNVRMLKEIGIYAIAIPLVGFALSALARLVLGVDAVETSVRLHGFSMGLIVLCLTQFFAHGLALENDVEGLL